MCKRCSGLVAYGFAFMIPRVFKERSGRHTYWFFSSGGLAQRAAARKEYRTLEVEVADVEAVVIEMSGNGAWPNWARSRQRPAPPAGVIIH